MRVCIDLTSLADNFSGIERYAACITKELIYNHKDEFVLIFKNEIHKMFEKIKLQSNIQCVVIYGKNKLFFNQIRLPLVMHKIKADYYLFLAFPVPILSFKKNMISTIHDICCWDCPETMNGMSKWYFRISHRIALKKCKAIITISEFSKKRIHEKLKYPKEKIWLIYCGIDMDYFKVHPQKTAEIKQKYNLPDEYILSLSTLEPRKNLPLLIKAYAELNNERKMIPNLVLAGRKGWKMDDYLSSISNEIRESIHFTGFIDDEDLPDIYHNAKLFVFPSMYEGFGMPPLEAMACGAPVISSDAASLPEVIGEAGILFKSGDTELLKRSIIDGLNLSKDEKANRIQLGKVKCNSFVWANEAEKLYSMLSNKNGRIL